MSEKVVQSVEDLTSRQAEIWGASVSASTTQWHDALKATNTAVQSELSQAIQASMVTHAETLTAAQEKVSEQSLAKWDAIQQGMLQQASTLSTQGDNVAQQTAIMERVLSAVGDVNNLETALNQNLSALASSKNFEDTVMSLSAAIQLLTSRLGVASPGVKLTDNTNVEVSERLEAETETKGRAA